MLSFVLRSFLFVQLLHGYLACTMWKPEPLDCVDWVWVKVGDPEFDCTTWECPNGQS